MQPRKGELGREEGEREKNRGRGKERSYVLSHLILFQGGKRGLEARISGEKGRGLTRRSVKKGRKDLDGAIVGKNKKTGCAGKGLKCRVREGGGDFRKSKPREKERLPCRAQGPFF